MEDKEIRIEDPEEMTEETEIEFEDEIEEAGQEAAEEEAANESGESEKLDEGFFPESGKKKSKKKDSKDVRIEELTDQVKRQMAEFDNFRKRTDKEKSQMFETGARSIIEKIIPVVDNFERGLEALTPEDKESSIGQGMEQIYKQLVTTLEEIGVTTIPAVGESFDPNLHNAVMHIDDEAYGENMIAEEFQKGYMYRDTVVRYSMVKVAN